MHACCLTASLSLRSGVDMNTKQIGDSHPQYSLLAQGGTVTAVGLDRTACMVTFGETVHKLLIGRGGAFQLAVSKSKGEHVSLAKIQSSGLGKFETAVDLWRAAMERFSVKLPRAHWIRPLILGYK